MAVTLAAPPLEIQPGKIARWQGVFISPSAQYTLSKIDGLVLFTVRRGRPKRENFHMRPRARGRARLAWPGARRAAVVVEARLLRRLGRAAADGIVEPQDHRAADRQDAQVLHQGRRVEVAAEAVGAQDVLAG